MKNLLALLVPAALLVGTLVSKEAVSTKDAPSAAGAYSQAIKAGGFVFAAGQIARDPATNKWSRATSRPNEAALVEIDVVALR